MGLPVDSVYVVSIFSVFLLVQAYKAKFASLPSIPEKAWSFVLALIEKTNIHEPVFNLSLAYLDMNKNLKSFKILEL